MGGFHLVEPVQGDPTSAGATANVQSTSTGVTRTDAEKGRSLGNKVELEEGRVTILTMEMLRKLVNNDPEFRIRITDGEIADRSKGDALAKMILILQSSWFICQCIARYVQGLSLTQLELTTLALASLNGITFVLWWDKPVGVETPVRVYMKRKLTDTERAGGRRSVYYQDNELEHPALGSARARFGLQLIPNFGDSRPISILRFTAWLILGIPALPLLFGFTFLYTISDVVWTSSSFPADATHVPTFYVPRHQYSKFWHVLLLLVFGTIFSGIHCAGWSLRFPTPAEQILWQIASVAVTVFPIAVIPFAVAILLFPSLIASIIESIIYLIEFIVKLILNFITFLLCRSHLIHLIPTLRVIDLTEILSESFAGTRLQSHLTYLMLAYGFARLVLLGLAVALLRDQPPSAFTAIDWTRFYPHTF